MRKTIMTIMTAVTMATTALTPVSAMAAEAGAVGTAPVYADEFIPEVKEIVTAISSGDMNLLQKLAGRFDKYQKSVALCKVHTGVSGSSTMDYYLIPTSIGTVTIIREDAKDYGIITSIAYARSSASAAASYIETQKRYDVRWAQMGANVGTGIYQYGVNFFIEGDTVVQYNKAIYINGFEYGETAKFKSIAFGSY